MEPRLRGDGRRGCASVRRRVTALLVCWVAASICGPGARQASAAVWRWGDLRIGFDSFMSIATSLRTQSRDCRQIAAVNGGCNPLNRWTAPPLARAQDPIEGRLLNADDGNLNWDKGDVFSILMKASHDLQAQWRQYGAFLRVSYFVDAEQIQGDGPRRTDLSREARFRGNLMEGGVVGAHFQVLDAYVYGAWDVGRWHLDARVGNQVLSWGESVFTQGGINTINGLDVTKIRLPGTELKEALLPAPIARLAGNLWGPLGYEVYYQFGWKRTDVDPVGSFFSSSDQVGRGAQGFFFPVGCGDPGTPIPLRRPLLGACPATQDPAAMTRFPIGLPRVSDAEPGSQGQWGAALRYYVDAIETEVGAYYIRQHDQFPTVSWRGTPQGGLAYFVEYPEDIDVYGFGFNTLIAGIAVGGEFSYRRGQPTPVTSNPTAPFRDLQAIVLNLLFGGAGGVAHGFVREDRMVAVLNGIYSIAPGTPYLGVVLDAIRASEAIFVGEIAVTSYPRMTLPRIYYAGPLGASEVDGTGFGYQLRVSASYDRFLGTAITLTPAVAFRHDAQGITPSGNAAFNEGLMQVGLSLEANWQQRWVGTVSYFNSFGAGMRNGSNDRDFVGLSLSYSF